MIKQLNTGIGDKKYFDRYIGRRPKFYRYILADIVQYSKPGKILDLGAGLGLFVDLATQWGFDCEGIDGAKINPNIKSHKFSEKFPYKNKSFQTIVINQVIQYLEPEVLNNVLGESFRMLKDSGVILIYSPNRKLGIELSTPVLPSHLKSILLKAGFKNLINKSSASNIFLYAIYKVIGYDFLANTSNFIGFKVENDPVH